MGSHLSHQSAIERLLAPLPVCDREFPTWHTSSRCVPGGPTLKRTPALVEQHLWNTQEEPYGTEG